MEKVVYIVEVTTEDGKTKYVGYNGIKIGIVDHIDEAAQCKGDLFPKDVYFPKVKNLNPRIRKIKISYKLIK